MSAVIKKRTGIFFSIVFFVLLVLPVTIQILDVGVPAVSVNTVFAQTGNVTSSSTGQGGWGGASDAFFSDFFSVSAHINSGVETVLSYLGSLVLHIIALLLGVAGVLLNVSVEINTKAMAEFVNNASGIDAAWRVIRDLLNIVILFTLLFSAVGMILRSDKIVSRKVLTNVIIAALLINFSMFFTKAIVDVSNVATYQINQEVNKIAEKHSTSLTIGVAGVFMEALDPTNALSNYFGGEGQVFLHSSLTQTILGILVLLVATFVFLLAAFLLFVRFGMILFLLVTSPIGFIGGLSPRLDELKKKWWEALTGQAIFAPVFLLFILVTLRIITDGQIKSALHGLGTVYGSKEQAYFQFAGGVEGLLMYLLIIFFLIASVVSAKMLSGSAGKGIVGAASSWAGKAAFGGAAFVGANTLGRVGRSWAESADLNRRAAEGNIGAQAQIAAGQWLQKKSFDVRGADWAKDLGAGKAAPGYAKRREERAKRMEGYGKKAGPSGEEYQKDKIAAATRDVEYTQGQINTLNEKRESGEINEEEFNDKMAEFKASLEKYTKALANTKEEGTFTDRENALQKEIAGLTRTLGRSGISRIRMLEERIKKENKKMSDDERLGLLRAQLNGSEVNYVDALKKLADVQKEKSGAQKQLKETLAGTYADSRLVGSNKDFSDKLRKEMREKPVAEEVMEKIKNSIKDDKSGESEEPPKKEGEGAPGTS